MMSQTDFTVPVAYKDTHMKKILAIILMATLAQSGVALAHDGDRYQGAGLHTPRVYRDTVVVHDNNDGLALIAGAVAGYIIGSGQEPQRQLQYTPQTEYRIVCEPVYRVVASTVNQYGEQQQVFQQIGCQ